MSGEGYGIAMHTREHVASRITANKLSPIGDDQGFLQMAVEN